MIFFLIFQMTLKYGKQPIATVCRALIVSLNGTIEQLTESDVDDFVNDVYVELKKRYKMQKNSEILFRFPRLFFIARKA